MLEENDKYFKNTFDININVILNDIEAITMRIKLIFNRECEIYK